MIKFSAKRANPHFMIGKLNVFLLLKNRRYGSGLVIEWGDRVRTFPTNLFERDSS